MTQPTYTELVELIVEMRTELNILRAENAALKVRVADLEAQLRTNSQNSSQPPRPTDPAKRRPGRCAHRPPANPVDRPGTADKPWPRSPTRMW